MLGILLICRISVARDITKTVSVCLQVDLCDVVVVCAGFSGQKKPGTLAWFRYSFTLNGGPD